MDRVTGTKWIDDHLKQGRNRRTKRYWWYRAAHWGRTCFSGTRRVPRVVRFIVVEQDIPPLMSVDADVASTFGSGQRWNFRRFGGQADLHTLESGHTATGGWCPPPTNTSRHEKTNDIVGASNISYQQQFRQQEICIIL